MDLRKGAVAGVLSLILACTHRPHNVPMHAMVVGRYDVYMLEKITFVYHREPAVPYGFLFSEANGPFGLLYRAPTKREYSALGIVNSVLPHSENGDVALGCINHVAGFTPCSESEHLAIVMGLGDLMRRVRTERGNDWFFNVK